MISTIAKYMDKFIMGLSIVITAAITINMITAVIFRYFFQSPISWADELSLFLFCWLTFLGGSLAIKRAEMPAVTILFGRLPSSLKLVASLFIQGCTLLFALIVLYYSYFWITSPSVMGKQSVNLPINLAILYIIVPISMLSMVVYAISHIANILKNGVSDGSEVEHQ